MRYTALTLLPLLASASPTFKVGTIHNGAAPVLSSTHAEEIPNSYMVVFKKHVKHADAKNHHDWIQSVHTKSNTERMELRKRSQLPLQTDIFEGLKHTYNIVGGMMGYSGHFDEETLEQNRRHPDVSHFSSFPHHRLFPTKRIRYTTTASPPYALSRWKVSRGYRGGADRSTPARISVGSSAERYAIRRNPT